MKKSFKKVKQNQTVDKEKLLMHPFDSPDRSFDASVSTTSTCFLFAWIENVQAGGEDAAAASGWRFRGNWRQMEQVVGGGYGLCHTLH